MAVTIMRMIVVFMVTVLMPTLLGMGVMTFIVMMFRGFVRLMFGIGVVLAVVRLLVVGERSGLGCLGLGALDDLALDALAAAASAGTAMA